VRENAIKRAPDNPILRAILCNDSLVKKLEELERTENMYKGLVEHCKRVLRGYFDLLMVAREMGDIFCSIGVREPQKTASEAFCMFGEYHRQMEKYGIKMLKATKPVRGTIALNSVIINVCRFYTTWALT